MKSTDIKGNAPLFSVVIPLYNKADTILRTLKSVVNQAFRDYEIVVVDDGSKDGGAMLVESFSGGKNIRLVRQQNAGVSAARNRGVRESIGKYVAFLDADDEWKVDFLKECSIILQNYPEAKVLGTNYECVRQGKVVKGFESSRIDCIDFYDEWPYRTPVNSSSMVVEKEAFLEVGGYSDGVGFYEDAELLFKLASMHCFYISRKSLARYNNDASERATQKSVSYSKYPHWQWAKMMIVEGRASESLRVCMAHEWLRALSNNIRHLRFDINKTLLECYPILRKDLVKNVKRYVWTSWIGVPLGWLVWVIFKIQGKIYYRVIIGNDEHKALDR